MSNLAPSSGAGKTLSANEPFGDIAGRYVASNQQTRPAGDDTQLQADEGQMRQFVETIFRNCSGGVGWISLRAFQHEGSSAAVVNEWVPFGDGLVPSAVRTATAVANRPFDRRAVFSPPVCVFGDMGLADGKRVASEANVVSAPAIAVELDERPADSLRDLVDVLGPPSLVMASGGRWCDPADGLELRVEDKLHAYWRLRVPATAEADRLALRQARALATRLVASDVTGVPLSHPMRWAGSWHTKARQVRLARIVGGDPSRDVELSWALEVLREAVEAAGLDAGGPASIIRGERQGFKTREEWSADALRDAARLIPNHGLAWDEWNRVGMAIWDASHASVEGLDAFHDWSAKDDRYTPETTDARWSHWSGSPPANLSGGTLLHEIRKAEPAYGRAAPVDPTLYFEKSDPAALEGSTSGRKRFTFESFENVANAAVSQPSRPLVKGLLDQGAMTVLYGESNSGKTFITLDLAFHVAAGRSWNGLKVTRAPVVYVAAEGGRGVAKRVAALRSRYGSDGGYLHLLREPVNLLRPDADLGLLIEALREFKTPAGLVVIDTLSRALAGGDENASTDMGAMVRNLDAIRTATGAHLLVVHHTGKIASKGARGHSLLRAATDTEIEVADGMLKATKQRDIEKNLSVAFALENVVLGVDEEGDPITSATVRFIQAREPDASQAEAQSPQEAEYRARVALAAYRALDGSTFATVPTAAGRLREELERAGVKVGNSMPTLRDKLKDALSEPGVEVEASGQLVLVSVSKAGAAAKAAWVVRALRVPGEAYSAPKSTAETDGSTVDENDENA